jgi:hypothetical protein
MEIYAKSRGAIPEAEDTSASDAPLFLRRCSLFQEFEGGRVEARERAREPARGALAPPRLPSSPVP